jgi:hypothetical protein
MNFLANCDAIIIDLRQNGGGDPSQIQFITSYLFGSPTHLNDIYTRSENKTENFWTLPYVPGKKLEKADVYVLTSSFTFSGAEEFSYNLKNLKRATVIGETTGGGAHPTEPKIVQGKFILSVPYARAINPITKTNWEGVGVTPDIQVPADKAFDKAYLLALEKLAAKASDQRKQDAHQQVPGDARNEMDFPDGMEPYESNDPGSQNGPETPSCQLPSQNIRQCCFIAGVDGEEIQLAREYKSDDCPKPKQAETSNPPLLPGLHCFILFRREAYLNFPGANVP